MGKFLDGLSKGLGWLMNPIGMIIDEFQPTAYNGQHDPDTGEWIYDKTGTTVSPGRTVINDIGDKISDLWDDATGKSQIERQNELDRQMAEEEYERNLKSIGDTAAAYEAAGFNRNLMYSQGSQSYQAPNLQAYSGSAKLDTILSRIGKVLNFIPAMYQATAALESIDQAREKTKQAEIKTMADGINLLNSGYNFGKLQYSLPFIPKFKRIGRNWEDQSDFISFARGDYTQRYADAALKNTFDNLAAIGISNDLRNTRNSYLGYQYDLDRRFGAAGRIVGMASQGLGAASKFLPLNSFFRRK